MSHTSRIASIVLSAGLACAASAQSTQPNPLSQFEAEVDINSGRVVNTTNDLTAVVSEIITIQDADWLRLTFDEVTLAGSDATGNASFLQITSLEDGAVQYLDSESIAQWQYTSAYFNGESILIELMAYPNSGFNELSISSVIAGTPPAFEESICGTTDDRALSSDPRAARALPIGCTAWMIDDCEHCFLTAGHCNASGNTNINVLEFNVPLSDNSCAFPGGLNHPSPDDQYAVDATSQQTNGGQGVGNDWGYLGAFPNSNTGLLPWQVSGSWYTLNTGAPTATTARVTGYGSVSSPVSCTWNSVQKTHAGPFFSLSGTALGYGMDTSGGNSGSPVTDETTGEAIGIHTHGGCSSGGGNNSGTWAGHAGLLSALANPQGVCEPKGPLFSFPNGLPEFIDPDGQNLTVNIAANGAIIPDPATAEFIYDDGSGPITTSLSPLGGDVYVAALPGGDCFDAITFSFAIDDTAGESYTNPNNGGYSGTIATGTVVTVDLDMNSDPSWTTASTASTGAWERAIPGDYGRSDPTADADGSGLCWVTDNAPNEDVDNGIVTLTTATYDVSGSPEAVVSYAVHHITNDPTDAFTVEISNNNGSTWTTLETIAGSTANWETHAFRIADFVTPTSQVVLRFESRDIGGASITESGVDAFRILTVECDDVCLPDVNGDGMVTPTDFTAWINAFNNNLPSCDQNGDGMCTATDFTAWINNFNAGCP